MKLLFVGAISLATAVGAAEETGIAKWDPAMVVRNAVVDTNGVKWIDGKYLPIEGRAFDDTEFYFDRLPANVTTNVNGGVRSMKHHTSGMMFRFRTDSDFLHFKWKPVETWLSMFHQPATGSSGIDVYRFDEPSGKWRYVATGAIHKSAEIGGSLRLKWKPGDACLVNLPLYNGFRSCELGIAKNAKVEALGPRRSGIDRPVVFYGTSITHGGCSSRPGLAFVNRIGRELDVPVVGLGFSGSGVMELEMSRHIARIDASCYVLDCLWNMGTVKGPSRKGRNIEENYEPFIRDLRARRPDTPIVMAEACDCFFGTGSHSQQWKKMHAYLRGLYDKLIAEGWTNLYYLPNDEMYTGDYEGTVDGVHPNDLGMESLSKAFGKMLRKVLRLDTPGRENRKQEKINEDQ